MKKFLLRLLLFLAPFFCLLVVYFIEDPFKVLYHYDAYYTSDYHNQVELDKDFTSVQNFLNKNPKYHYDSFIFGNSQSMFYNIDKWGKYVGSNKCYHFDAYSESIYGISKKIDLLTKMHSPIKNAVVVLDYSVFLETGNSRGHRYIKHPILSGEGYIPFQLEFLKTYFNAEFLVAYLDFKLTGKVKPYMTKEQMLTDYLMKYDTVTNEIRFPHFDSIIAVNRKAYYSPKEKLFVRKDTAVVHRPSIIKQPQKDFLQHIKQVFEQNNTHYNIVISPLYSWERLSDEDYNYLVNLFGKDKVFDFSGKNDITNNYQNYYEPYHYRPAVGDEIMEKIYGKLPQGDAPDKH